MAQKKPVKKKKSRVDQGEDGPRISRGRFDSLVLYEVTEDELDVLEKGSPSSIFLNFAIFLLSVSISFFAIIFTVEVTPLSKFVVFLIVALVGLIIGSVLLVLWFRSRKTSKTVVRKIKKRLEG